MAALWGHHLISLFSRCRNWVFENLRKFLVMKQLRQIWKLNPTHYSRASALHSCAAHHTLNIRVSVLFDEPFAKKPRPGRRTPRLASTQPQIRSAAEEGSLFSSSVNRTKLCNPAGPCALVTNKVSPPLSGYSLLHFFIQKCLALLQYTFWANLAVKWTLNQALTQKKIKPICSDDSSWLMIWEWQRWCTLQTPLSWSNGQVLAEGKACGPEGKLVHQLTQPRLWGNTHPQKTKEALANLREYLGKQTFSTFSKINLKESGSYEKAHVIYFFLP